MMDWPDDLQMRVLPCSPKQIIMRIHSWQAKPRVHLSCPHPPDPSVDKVLSGHCKIRGGACERDEPRASEPKGISQSTLQRNFARHATARQTIESRTRGRDKRPHENITNLNPFVSTSPIAHMEHETALRDALSEDGDL